MEGKTAIDYADAAGFDEAVEQLERTIALAVPPPPAPACIQQCGPWAVRHTYLQRARAPAHAPVHAHARACARIHLHTMRVCMLRVQAERGGQNPPPSHRGGGMTNRGGGTARMTPRVPNNGDVAPKMTPRMPIGGHRPGFTPRGSKPSEPVVLRPEQVATLDRDTMKFLTKKLVHLTVLLEQDTVADDSKYPSFYSV